MLRLLCISLLLSLFTLKIAWSKFYIEKDFLLYSKDIRFGYYYSVNLNEKFQLTFGYERMFEQDNIITTLNYSFKNSKFHILYEKNSLGFAIEKEIKQNIFYAELNNLKEKEINIYYYHKITDNIFLKFGIEKLNKEKLDPMVGFYVDF
ncbi:MAG: hypothetical protein ABDH21_05210 [bacterium]